VANDRHRVNSSSSRHHHYMMVNIDSKSDYYSTCPVSLIINRLNQYCYQMTVGDGYFAVSDQITSTDISLMVICHSWDNTFFVLHNTELIKHESSKSTCFKNIHSSIYKIKMWGI